MIRAELFIRQSFIERGVPIEMLMSGVLGAMDEARCERSETRVTVCSRHMGDISLAGQPAKEMLMPWKKCSVMDERLRFIARLLEGESTSDLCREAGISRKTGYKILGRYKEEGVTAISDRSRRPWRYANQLPQQLEAMILGLKKDKRDCQEFREGRRF